MAIRLSAATLIISVLSLLIVSAGCGKDAPTSPSRSTTPKSPIALTVNGISPSSGSRSGGTQVEISGFGFTSDSTVIFGGAPMKVTYVNSQHLAATTPARAAGSVDVVVTNPGGETSRLEGAYTYVVIPPPSITGIQENVGSTSGGGPVTITGTGFVAGAVATLDGVRIGGYVYQGSILATAPAHAAGKVDLVVTNPDGQADTLSGGYTYVSPETFDINGEWKGGADSNYGTDFGFTIRNGAVISVSCGIFSSETPPVPVVTGRFSVVDTEGVSISGAIVSPGLALGWISIGGVKFCDKEPWYAEKK
jgi:IPT/TIG domain